MTGYTARSSAMGSWSEFKHFMFAQFRRLPQADYSKPLTLTYAMFIYSDDMSVSSGTGHEAQCLSRHDKSSDANENMKYESNAGKLNFNYLPHKTTR